METGNTEAQSAQGPYDSNPRVRSVLYVLHHMVNVPAEVLV